MKKSNYNRTNFTYPNYNTINIGILAHVDAGKTSLTERLLYDYGAIKDLGSVDKGTTKTDTAELEKKRGITIKTGVASFVSNNILINLVDTPGHPEFIAEVERSLSILDGAILVISAVEGVQSQTRILMKTLKKMKIPTIIFINKIDRKGAKSKELLEEIIYKLTPIIEINMVENLGSTEALAIKIPINDKQTIQTLAENDEVLLEKFLENRSLEKKYLEKKLIEQTNSCLVCPVFFGSAITGVGVKSLVEGVKTLFNPKPASNNNKDVSGVVFSIQRLKNKEKVIYLKLFSGEIESRQELKFKRLGKDGKFKEWTSKISTLEVLGVDKILLPNDILTAGNLAKIKGVGDVRVGDFIGNYKPISHKTGLPEPSFSSIIKAKNSAYRGNLFSAIKYLEDEDSFIQTKISRNGEISLLLYGQLQKEIILARLNVEFQIEAEFEEEKILYFERPIGVGNYLVELDPLDQNPLYWATVGLRIEPAARGSGNSYTRETMWGTVPPAFHKAIEETVFDCFQSGLFGFGLKDCKVFLTKIGYNDASSTAADFRELTKIVFQKALNVSQTKVFEPVLQLDIEIPTENVELVVSYLNKLRGNIISINTTIGNDFANIEAKLPARFVNDFKIELSKLSKGEGVVCTSPGGDVKK